LTLPPRSSTQAIPPGRGLDLRSNGSWGPRSNSGIATGNRPRRSTEATKRRRPARPSLGDPPFTWKSPESPGPAIEDPEGPLELAIATPVTVGNRNVRGKALAGERLALGCQEFTHRQVQGTAFV